MTAWTDPDTGVVSTNELGTSTWANTFVINNSKHLNETKSELACTTVVDDTTPATTTSTSYADLSDDCAITTTATSDIILIAVVKAKHSNNTYTATLAIHNGSTQGETQVLENEAWFLDYHTYVFVETLESAAAGTHTFKVQGLVNNASTTLTVDDVKMVAFALSE